MTEEQVREKLNEYRRLYKDLEKAIKDLQALGEKAVAIGSIAPKEVDVLSSGSLSARWEDIIANKVELEAVIAEELDNFERQKSETITFICNAEPRYRYVLLAYYIYGLSNREVAEMLHYEIRTVKKMKKRGIVQLAKVGTPRTPIRVI